MIEAIPNISEGRRPDVIRAAVDAVEAVDGVRLLDWSSDATHHRSVLTLVGEADPLRAAILELVAVAVSEIDLRRHAGAHPRIGAVDVVPFVPLDATPMTACIDLARSTGAALAERFDLPVWLYAEAATAPGRRPLEAVRRGQFEGLGPKLAEPDWRPDYGPARPHPSAGACAVGARRSLVAFNVNLATPDLAVARAIARAVRASGGGLAHVKAIGVQLADPGLVQVSMNLTDYVRTPLAVALERVTREAARRGVAVATTELVGLIPAAAVAGSVGGVAVRDLIRRDQTLEARRAAAGPPAQRPSSAPR